MLRVDRSAGTGAERARAGHLHRIGAPRAPRSGLRHRPSKELEERLQGVAMTPRRAVQDLTRDSGTPVADGRCQPAPEPAHTGASARAAPSRRHRRAPLTTLASNPPGDPRTGSWRGARSGSPAGPPGRPGRRRRDRRHRHAGGDGCTTHRRTAAAPVCIRVRQRHLDPE